MICPVALVSGKEVSSSPIHRKVRDNFLEEMIFPDGGGGKEKWSRSFLDVRWRPPPRPEGRLPVRP